MGTMYDRYQRIRNARGYKDSDVAKATGISKATLSDWKNGKSQPKFQKLQSIANFLGCSLNDFAEEDPLEYAMGVVVKTLGNGHLSTTKKQENYYLDEEASEIAQFLFDNPEYKVLFDASRRVSKKDIDMVKALLDKFKSDDEE